jgi:hypothetical protein
MISNEVEGFFRDFEIRDEQTFYDFHQAIQEELGYDTSQLASFFLSTKHWEKGLEFTLFEMSDPHSEDNNSMTMDMAKLSEYIAANKQHLLYVYDFFSERAFFLELVKVKEDNTDKKYPVCVEGRGEAPEQIIIDATELDLNEPGGSPSDDDPGNIAGTDDFILDE